MRRAVAAATVGNALEFYDFVTYAFFAIQIGHTFFPSDDAFLSLMGSLATFGAGFLSRPVGAYVLGGYADRHGRKPAMLLSMTMMGLAIAAMALTPGYAAIGVAAPVIAVLARLVQGFALGGEVGSATTYMMEAVTDRRRGASISWQGASQHISSTVGALVGLGLSLAMSDAALSAYGWRIALLLGTTIVPFALLIRRSLPETLDRPGEELLPPGSARGYGRVVALGLVIIGSVTISTYIFQYMATFGQHTLGISTSLSMGGEFANNAVAVIAMLAGGWLSDRFGRRPLMIWPQVAFVLLIVPCFAWLIGTRTAFAFIGANIVLSLVGSVGTGATYAAISESLPRAVRARAFALVYALPVTILGGSTQLVVTWILKATGNPMAIAWYLTAICFTGLAAMWLMTESAPAKLASR